ncbi:MAG TPA: 3-hydroxyacyl-CoA dehydrogenase family protein [Nitrososphaerales archaeon]|nr:3-hydroxyacyl-CoA dehydrogenase family protein [Nitrososphaerales archaeon]
MPDPGPGNISVIGFGLMGAQISQILSLAGYVVTAYDIDDEKLCRGIGLIESGKYGLENSVKSGRISKDDATGALSRIETTSSLEKALDHAQFVLEAAVEDLKIKQEIFKQAARLAEVDAVLATNTSTISVGQIGKNQRLKDTERLAGMHFFNPPQLMKLVEIVKTKKTLPAIISRIEKVSKTLGKISIVVMDSPAFVANRIGLSVFSEASALLEKGVANVRDIDLSMRLGYGYPMGPFELGDLVGLDARLRNMDALYKETREEKFRPPKILRRLVAEGYLGDPKVKSESRGGYYEYFRLKRPSDT